MFQVRVQPELLQWRASGWIVRWDVKRAIKRAKRAWHHRHLAFTNHFLKFWYELRSTSFYNEKFDDLVIQTDFGFIHPV